MKRTYIAAAALLLGTSAFAWAPSSAPVAHDAKDPVAVGEVDKDAKLAKAAFTPTPETVWWTEEAQLQPAAFQSWDDQPAPAAGDPDLDLSQTPDAEDPAAHETSMGELAEPHPDATEAGMTDAATGMGGPVETADASTVAADLAPRPATQNYPPCDPGPGDDNCIQLYEPGVRVALASWNQPTGGLLDDRAATAMGGPYEPVASADGDVAMNGDGVVDPASGETAELEAADSGQYTGVGGPAVETGYPPCRPGPGDDRCIQLYEPGVTGAGN